MTVDLSKLPNKYFDLMNSGEALAKEGKFEEAYEKFSKAVDECEYIINFFMNKIADKTEDDKILEDLIIHQIWEAKLVKAAFFKHMALYNQKVKNADVHAKNELLICYGIQLLGYKIISTIKTYVKKYRKKLHFIIPDMVDIIIENWNSRQELLEKMLLEENIELPSLLPETI